MKILYSLVDNEFKKQEITHTRQIVRAVLINNNNQIAFIKLHGRDALGDRNYYELPGGGKKKGETLLNALHREILEETGFTIQSVIPLGRVIDYYNILSRRNDNHYFLAYIDSFNETHLTKFEKEIIEKVVWVDIDHALEVFKDVVDSPLSRLVRNRELSIIELAINRYKKGTR